MYGIKKSDIDAQAHFKLGYLRASTETTIRELKDFLSSNLLHGNQREDLQRILDTLVDKLHNQYTFEFEDD